MKFYLNRVKMNGQGYDSSGHYWGLGESLWHYYGEENIDGMQSGGLTPVRVEEGHFRARNREEAKDWLRKAYPNATFYR